ncbi:MAG: hypothetical protein KJ621_10335 [Proteobacteria bacterium]|nr:hypothetical protein [Pseudomonadota bacterium]MBU1740938.1 hypothetical protein [Pseudomonadota bacterium]
MDQRIFDQKLSVEATSAYIVLDTLSGGQDAPTLDQADNIWTGSPESLRRALRELERRRIIDLPEGPSGPVKLQPPDKWA